MQKRLYETLPDREYKALTLIVKNDGRLHCGYVRDNSALTGLERKGIIMLEQKRGGDILVVTQFGKECYVLVKRIREEKAVEKQMQKQRIKEG